MQQFSRIQIACEDVSQAAAEFTQLLAALPCWQGQIKEAPVDNSGAGGCVSQTYSAAWFYLENTLLELVPAAALAARTGISGFTLKPDNLEALAANLPKGAWCSREYHTEPENSQAASSTLEALFVDGVFTERLYRLDTDEANGLCIHMTESDLYAQPQDNVVQRRIDHIVLRTNDGDACVRLFSEQLQLRLALDQEKPEWGGRMLFFRSGKLTLEVIAPEGGLKAGDYFWGFALKIADMDAEHTRLQSAGVNISELRDGRKPDTRVATVKSHSGGVPALLVGV